MGPAVLSATAAATTLRCGRRTWGLTRRLRPRCSARRLERRNCKEVLASTAPQANWITPSQRRWRAISLAIHRTSGNRIVLHLVNAMKRLGTRRGITSDASAAGWVTPC
jgi:hypothetical protein